MSQVSSAQELAFEAQKAAFFDYLSRRGLKRTQQRELILDTFLRSEEHLTIEELSDKVRRVDSSVGYTTVYRTVNILVECGIAQELRLEGDVRRFERVHQNRHHDHLICVECGSTVEFFNCSLEILQIIAAGKHGFKPMRHTLKIYGLCRSCQVDGPVEKSGPAAG